MSALARITARAPWALLRNGANTARLRGAASASSVTQPEGDAFERTRDAGAPPSPTRTWTPPTLQLSASEVAALAERLLEVPSPHQKLEDALMASAEAFRVAAPPSLVALTRDFRGQPFGTGIARIRGLPLDRELPKTPCDGAPSREKQTFVSEASLLGMAQNLGEPIGYQGLKGGALVHDICPVPEADHAESNEGAKARFGLHTEVAFSPWRPRLLLLRCLREDVDKCALTLFSRATDALRKLDPAWESLLREPLFTTQAPQSFKALSAAHVLGPPHAVISGPRDAPAIIANMQTTVGLTVRHERALSALKRALAENTFAARIEEGDLFIFNNLAWMHGRSPFRATFDGRDRWLQRVYVRDGLYETRGAASPENPRLLEPIQI